MMMMMSYRNLRENNTQQTDETTEPDRRDQVIKLTYITDTLEQTQKLQGQSYSFCVFILHKLMSVLISVVKHFKANKIMLIVYTCKN